MFFKKKKYYKVTWAREKYLSDYTEIVKATNVVEACYKVIRKRGPMFQCEAEEMEEQNVR